MNVCIVEIQAEEKEIQSWCYHIQITITFLCFWWEKLKIAPMIGSMYMLTYTHILHEFPVTTRILRQNKRLPLPKSDVCSYICTYNLKVQKRVTMHKAKPTQESSLLWTLLVPLLSGHPKTKTYKLCMLFISGGERGSSPRSLGG